MRVWYLPTISLPLVMYFWMSAAFLFFRADARLLSTGDNPRSNLTGNPVTPSIWTLFTSLACSFLNVSSALSLKAFQSVISNTLRSVERDVLPAALRRRRCHTITTYDAGSTAVLLPPSCAGDRAALIHFQPEYIRPGIVPRDI